MPGRLNPAAVPADGLHVAVGGVLERRRAASLRTGEIPVRTAVPGPAHRAGWTSRPALAAAALTAGRLVGGLVLAALAVRFHAGGLGAAPGVGDAHSLTGAFMHWDAGWYRDIVRSGYAGAAARTSFFPVYPMLVHLLTATGLPYTGAALGLSWVALFFATWSVIELAGALFPEVRAARAGILFTWFPMSVFLLSGYAEAVFAALAGWSFVMVARRSYAPAVVLAALASAARPEGFLVGTAAVVALVLAGRYARAALAAVGGVAGLAAFSAYCWVQFGTPIAYVRVQAYWTRETTLPFVMVARNLHLLLIGAPGGGAYHLAILVQDVLIVGAAVAVVGLARLARRRPELGPFVPFTALTVLLAASNGVGGVLPNGSGRMILGLVPLYALTARAEGRRWRLLVAGSCVLAVLLQMLFNAGLTVI